MKPSPVSALQGLLLVAGVLAAGFIALFVVVRAIRFAWYS